MKKIVFLTLLLFSTYSYSQFFEQPSEEQEQTNQSFEPYSNDEYTDPDQGVDMGGNPGEPIPINDWLFLLPLAALAIGSHRLLRNKKERI
jgi:hypothetical protein